MKHASSQCVFDHWNHRRGNRTAPERADIEPGAIRTALADTFILDYDRRAGHPFRLAGTRVCAVFGRELKGEPFGVLWSAASRRSAGDLLGIVADECAGLVAGASGRNAEGQSVQFELMLLPLSYRGAPQGRILGVLAPIAAPHWIGASPIDDLSLGPLRHLGPAVETIAAPRLVAADPAARLRHRLVVHAGGRVD
jgi:hypothetical protein